MKIIQLTAENVKKLKVVDITPEGALVQVTGKNGNGKSSVLDCIWWALGGEKNISDVPIRRGAESARIRLDLGDMIVERKFGKGEGLVVRNKVGAEPGTPDKKLPAYGSPQDMLDSLIGRLSFDPTEFARQKPRDQYDTLKSIAKIEVDIDALGVANSVDFKTRTDINRQAKSKRALAEAIVIPDNLPAEPVDEAALLSEMEAAANHNNGIVAAAQNRDRMQRDANERKAVGIRHRETAAANREHAAKRVADLERQIVSIRKQIESARLEGEAMACSCEDDAEKSLHAAAEIEKKIDALPVPPAPIDLADVRAKINVSRATNQQIQKRTDRDKILKDAETLEVEAKRLTETMEARTKQSQEAIAKAQMPVEGLSLESGQILYNGLPFDQASDAERLRVSVAIAMAANPKIRVIRIQNGSLLDEDNLKLIADMAKDQDYQVWVEICTSSKDIGIVMEDGSIVADNQKKHAVEPVQGALNV